MSTKQNVILVPTDFSDASSHALEYAIEIAKICGYSLTILHILEDLPVDEYSKKMLHSSFIFRDISKRLEGEANRVTETMGVPCNFLIKEGNIFDHIGSTASEVGANLLLMGTHGVQGIQHLTGGFAARVIENTPVPCIVVQKQSSFRPYNRVVLPLDFANDTKPLEEWAIWVANRFNADIYLVISEANLPLSHQKVDLSLHQLQERLKSEGILFFQTSFKSKGEDFSKDVIDYASEIEAELIVIDQSKISTGFQVGKEEQKIITNPLGISVMCLNSKGDRLPG